MEERMIALLTNEFIPVLEDTETDIFPCITFHFYNETGAVFGCGKATEETASCQVDFWYHTKDSQITEAIKVITNKIKNDNKMSYPKKETVFEKDTRLYHTYVTFDLIKESGE